MGQEGLGKNSSEKTKGPMGFAACRALFFDRSVRYRNVNVSSIVMMTGTSWPFNRPGTKRHWRTALMVSATAFMLARGGDILDDY